MPRQDNFFEACVQIDRARPCVPVQGELLQTKIPRAGQGMFKRRREVTWLERSYRKIGEHLPRARCRRPLPESTFSVIGAR